MPVGQNEKILLESLQLLSRFQTKVDLVSNGDEFVKIHDRNLAMLKDVAQSRNSAYMYRLIDSYPKVISNEIDHFISKERKEKSLLDLAIFFWFGIIISALFSGLWSTARNRGNTIRMIRSKIKKISALNEKFINIVKDPIFEELYQK